MKIKIHLIAIILVLVFRSFISDAQPMVLDVKVLKEIKNATLYIVMSENEINDAYIDVFKETWTYCPYEIINEDHILDFMHKGSLFMQLIPNCLGKDIDKLKKIEYNKNTKYSITYNLYFYTPKTEFLKKLEGNQIKSQNFNLNEIVTIVGNINLQPDDSKRFKVYDPMTTDFMGKGFLITSGPGILKNYLQFFQKSMEEKIFWFESTEFFNEKEIKRVKSKTLYIPEELLKGYDWDDYRENEYVMDEIVKQADYPGEYKVISMKKLNELILRSDEAFFYISFYSFRQDSNATLSMTVTNGLTGDIISKEFEFSNKSFSAKLFKKLSKRVSK